MKPITERERLEARSRAYEDEARREWQLLIALICFGMAGLLGLLAWLIA